MPTFRINGVVGEEFQVADLHAFLESAAGSPVDIVINSPGGSVFEGLSAYNALAEYKGVVTITVDALAASAASLIFMAGTRRVMLEGAMLMLHRSSGLTAGNKDAHTKTAEVLAKIDQQAIGIYSKVSGLSASRVTALLDDETWLYAEQALKLGFATDASADAATAQITGFDLTNYRHPPARLVAMAKKDTIMTTKPNAEPPPPAHREIFDLCSHAKLSMTETDVVMQAANGNIDTARIRVIDMLAAKAGDQTHIPAAVGGGDDLTPMAKAVEDVLYARMSHTPVPKGPAQQFDGRNLLDIGAKLLESNGVKIKSWHRDKLASQILMNAGLNSTSDFPFLLGNAGQRLLGDAYETAASPLKQLARRRTASDFRAIMIGRLGEMPSLEEVPEGGEILYGSRTVASESFSIKTFAKIFAITRQALINDDLGAFADSARAWGQAAAALEADQLFALINGGGPIMEDGERLFSAAHANLMEADSLSNLDQLAEGRKLLRLTKGIDGTTPINVTPKFLVVGPEQENTADLLTAAVMPSNVEDVNIWFGKIQVLVEPRIVDNQWWIFSAPEQAEVIAYAYLGDNSGPHLDVREGWNVLGSEFRCVHDFGAGATGWRGAVYNAGDEITG